MGGVERLIGRWTERAGRLREWAAAEEAARAWEAAAWELQTALDEDGEELLNLQEAAVASGYSAEHLGRLVRQGRIDNAGRPNAPRIRLRDLPRKPGGRSEAAAPRVLESKRAAVVEVLEHSQARGDERAA